MSIEGKRDREQLENLKEGELIKLLAKYYGDELIRVLRAFWYGMGKYGDIEKNSRILPFFVKIAYSIGEGILDECSVTLIKRVISQFELLFENLRKYYGVNSNEEVVNQLNAIIMGFVEQRIRKGHFTIGQAEDMIIGLEDLDKIPVYENVVEGRKRTPIGILEGASLDFRGVRKTLALYGDFFQELGFMNDIVILGDVASGIVDAAVLSLILRRIYGEDKVNFYLFSHSTAKRNEIAPTLSPRFMKDYIEGIIFVDSTFVIVREFSSSGRGIVNTSRSLKEICPGSQIYAFTSAGASHIKRKWPLENVELIPLKTTKNILSPESSEDSSTGLFRVKVF